MSVMNTKNVLLLCLLGFNHYAEARRKQASTTNFSFFCFDRVKWKEKASQME